MWADGIRGQKWVICTNCNTKKVVKHCGEDWHKSRSGGFPCPCGGVFLDEWHYNIWIKDEEKKRIISFTPKEFALMVEVIDSLIECYGDWEEGTDALYTKEDWETYKLIMKKFGMEEVEDEIEEENKEEVKKLAEEIIQETASEAGLDSYLENLKLRTKARVEDDDRCLAMTSTTGVSGTKWDARCQLKKGHSGSHKRGKIVWD